VSVFFNILAKSFSVDCFSALNPFHLSHVLKIAEKLNTLSIEFQGFILMILFVELYG